MFSVNLISVSVRWSFDTAQVGLELAILLLPFSSTVTKGVPLSCQLYDFFSNDADFEIQRGSSF